MFRVLSVRINYDVNSKIQEGYKCLILYGLFFFNPTTLCVVVQVWGVAVRRTPASALSPPLSLSLLSPSLPPSRTLSTPLPLPSLSLSPSFTPSPLSLSPPLPLSLSKGSGAQGFGTERARLVVQVERLWCTRLRHRTCKTSGSSQIRCTRLRHRTFKTSGSSQKKGLLPIGISIFFSQNIPNFEN